MVIVDNKSSKGSLFMKRVTAVSICELSVTRRLTLVFPIVGPNAGEMMMSVFWYYRPEQTEVGRVPNFHGEVRLLPMNFKQMNFSMTGVDYPRPG